MDDWGGLTDPFMDVLYGGLKTTSTILKKTLDPSWNEDLLVNQNQCDIFNLNVAPYFLTNHQQSRNS